MLNDWSGVNIPKAVEFIVMSQGYDGQPRPISRTAVSNYICFVEGRKSNEEVNTHASSAAPSVRVVGVGIHTFIACSTSCYPFGIFVCYLHFYNFSCLYL
jgi:hypothetical protein